MEKKSNIIFRIDEELHGMIREAADSLGMSVSRFLREATREKVDSVIDTALKTLVMSATPILMENGVSREDTQKFLSALCGKMGSKALRALLNLDADTYETVLLAKLEVARRHGEMPRPEEVTT